MQQLPWRRILYFIGAFAAVWVSVRFLIPFFLPFLLGALLSFSVRPMVELLEKKLHLPRPAAAAAGVGGGAVLLMGLLALPAAAIVRRLGTLPQLPAQLQALVTEAAAALEQGLLELASRAPDSLREPLTRTVAELFSGGSALMSRAASRLPGVATGLLGHLADGLLTCGTALLTAFMLSIRLPRLKAALDDCLPEPWKQRYLPMLNALRHTLRGWLTAQLKLMLVSFLLLSAGLLLLRVPAAPLWAGLIALVDAVPMLGTGTVLVPWSLLSLLRSDQIRFFGLLGLYAVTALSRSLLEPRLLGKSMGLDPLLALMALYAGLRLWGLGGMLLLPLALSMALRLCRREADPKS